jgi:AraC family transcriptional regulator, regulatory protein of adaptative response / methylated-DNA-[protein]-cysteine methyltransferase
MNLMASETALQLAPAGAHVNVAVDILSYAIGECALRKVLVARSVKGVCAIPLGATTTSLAARFRHALIVTNEALVHDDLAKVLRFVNKPAEGLRLTNTGTMAGR